MQQVFLYINKQIMLSKKLGKIKNKLGKEFQLLDYPDSNNLLILCPTHGVFKISYSNLLQNKYSCPICGKEARTKTKILNQSKKIISQFKEIHDDTYDYSKVKYVKNSKPIIIICKKHGEFQQTPKNHKKGNGCSKCYLENTNGKFMKEPEWRKWASDNMKKFRNSKEYKELLQTKYGVDNPGQLEKSKSRRLNTLNSKYCVDNGFQINIEKRIDKARKTKIKSGAWLADDKKSDFYKYSQRVWKYTRHSLLKNPTHAESLLENNGLTTYHIDHIFSIYDGFVNQVEPSIIGHIENLQRLSSLENIEKSKNSWITLSDLLEKIGPDPAVRKEKLLAKSV